jgi:hypothetical protein
MVVPCCLTTDFTSVGSSVQAFTEDEVSTDVKSSSESNEISSSTTDGLFSPRGGPFNPQIFTDSDWASSISRKSCQGCVFIIDGFPIAWYSKSQNSISLSTHEAEMFAASTAGRVSQYFRGLLSEIHMLPTNYCFTIYCDNQSAIHTVKNDTSLPAAKHMSIRVAYLRDLSAKKLINLVYIPSQNNLADIFTKSLPADSHVRLSSKLLVACPSNDAGISSSKSFDLSTPDASVLKLAGVPVK